MKRYLLGDICKVYSGIDLKDSDYKKSGIPVLKSSCVQDGFISNNVMFYADPEKHSLENLIKFGDIVITRDSFGKVGINLTDTNFLPIRTIFKLEPNISIISKKYLYYFLLSSSKEIHSHITGGNVSRPYKAPLLKISVLVPDLETWNRVVEYLDKLQELRKELKLRKRQGAYYRNKIMRNLQEYTLTRK